MENVQMGIKGDIYMALNFNGTDVGSNISINGNTVQNLKMGNTDVWNSRLLLPRVNIFSNYRYNYGRFIWFNNTIYVIGCNGEYSARKCYKYNKITNSWIEIAELPSGNANAPRFGFNSGYVFIFNNKLYAYVQFSTSWSWGVEIYKKMYYLNDTEDQWIEDSAVSFPQYSFSKDGTTYSLAVSPYYTFYDKYRQKYIVISGKNKSGEQIKAYQSSNFISWSSLSVDYSGTIEYMHSGDRLILADENPTNGNSFIVGGFYYSYNSYYSNLPMCYYLYGAKTSGYDLGYANIKTNLYEDRTYYSDLPYSTWVFELSKKRSQGSVYCGIVSLKNGELKIYKTTSSGWYPTSNFSLKYHIYGLTLNGTNYGQMMTIRGCIKIQGTNDIAIILNGDDNKFDGVIIQYDGTNLYCSNGTLRYHEYNV